MEKVTLLFRIFQEARLNVTLKGIKIDQHCRLVSGYLDATGVGLALMNEDLAAALSEILAALETVEGYFCSQRRDFARNRPNHSRSRALSR